MEEARMILLKSLEESQEYLEEALKDLTPEEMKASPSPASNSIAFILWHVTRTEDIWVNRVINEGEEIYAIGGWAEKLGTPPGESGHGYTAEQLNKWPVPELDTLKRYYQAVRKETINLIETITPEELAEEIETRRAKMTITAILAHLITEIALHVGQIHYIRGIQKGLLQTR